MRQHPSSQELNQTKLAINQGLFPQFANIVKRRPLIFICIFFLCGSIMVSLLAPWLGIKDATVMDPGHKLSPPSLEYFFGTDYLGRSLFARIIYGMRVSVLLGMASVLIAAAFGTTFGLLAGYKGGLLDTLLMRFMDVLFSFPTILMAIAITAVTGPGAYGAALAVVIVTIPAFTRVIRSSTISIRKREYVTSALVNGASGSRILIRHLLPNIVPTLVVQATFSVSAAMLIEGGLSFLGLGIQPPMPSLGSVLRDGKLYLQIAPWGVFFPGLILASIIMAINILGDELHELTDPRLANN